MRIPYTDLTPLNETFTEEDIYRLAGTVGLSVEKRKWFFICKKFQFWRQIDRNGVPLGSPYLVSPTLLGITDAMTWLMGYAVGRREP